jgi:anti-sigma B factor antagonist
MPEKSLTVVVKDGVTVVEFCEPKIFDLTATGIQNELISLVGAAGTPKLLLSFKNVEHISSAALGMLINVQKKVRLSRGKMILSDLHPQIYEVFQITTLNKMFEIYDTAENAVAHF